MFTREDLDILPDDVRKDIDTTVGTVASKAGNPVRANGAKLLVGQEFTIRMEMPTGKKNNKQSVGDAFQALLVEHTDSFPWTGIKTVEGRELSLAQLVKPGTGLFSTAAKTSKDGAALLMCALYKAENHTIRIKFTRQIPMLGRKADEQYTIREWRLVE